MKKLAFIIGFMILVFLLFSFNRKNVNDVYSARVGKDPITVTVPFEPIRIHRATTDRPRDGKNCGCNECFGLCNAPHGKGMKGETSRLGLYQSDKGSLTIFFLDKKPENFEKEFGIDEEMSFILSKELKVTIKKGEYTAMYEEGVVTDAEMAKEFKYFGKVTVAIL